MSEYQLTLAVRPDTFAICRLNSDAAIPDWAVAGALFSITRTADELSVVCRQADVPAAVKCENDWRCLKVEGTLDFSLIGIMAALAGPLAQAEISIFVISTFDTDYLLVKADKLEN